MSGLTRNGTAEPVSRQQIPGREQGQGKNSFPCPADRGQNWQPDPVDPYSVESVGHIYIHTCIYIYIYIYLVHRLIEFSHKLMSKIQSVIKWANFSADIFREAGIPPV